MRIYRKREFNFDYIAIVDKIVPELQVAEILKMANINSLQANTINQVVIKNNQNNFVVRNSQPRWLRVHACEIYKIDQMDSNFKRVKVCIEYLNFTLKDYLLKPPSTILPLNNMFPQPVLYILGSIIDSYTALTSHQFSASTLNLIKSITTFSLIYINPEGCLKFISLPLFNLEDHQEVK